MPRARKADAAILADFRAITLASVAFTCSAAPNFALREGAIIASLCGLTAISSGARTNRVDGAILSYVAIVVLSFFWTDSVDGTRNAAMNAVAYGVIAVSARLSIQRRRDFFLIAGGLVLGAAYLLVVLAMGAGWTVVSNFQAATGRYTVSSLNANYMAYVFVTALWLMVVARHLTSRKTRRAPFFLVALAFIPGIYLNGTRAALLSVLLIFLWTLVPKRLAVSLFKVSVVAVVSALFALASGFVDSLITQILVPSARERGDLNGRLSVWPAARELVMTEPLLGHGAASFAHADNNPHQIAAHNAVLDVATGVGIVGLALLVATLWFALATAESNATLRLLQGAYLVALAPILATGYWTESPVFWLSISLVAVLPVVQSSRSDPTNRSQA